MNSIPTFLFIFFGSFAATASQMILIKILESYLHHEVIVFTLVSAVAFFAYAWAARKSEFKKNLLQLSVSQICLMILTPLLALLMLWTPSLLIFRQLMDPVMSPFLASEYQGLLALETLVFVFLLSRFHGFELPVMLDLRNISLGASLASSYAGALAGFLLVPFVLLPALGIVRTSFAISLLYACNCLHLIRQHTKRKWILLFLLTVVASSLLAMGYFASLPESERMRKRLFYANGLEVWPEDPFSSVADLLGHLKNNIRIHSQESRYQTIDLIIYQNPQGPSLRLYLNLDFQFDSNLEKAYHQNFLKPISTFHRENLRRVLVLGAGDGLLCRDLLRQFPKIERIDLVELDEEVVNLATSDTDLISLNHSSLADPKVKIHINDAFQFIQSPGKLYDAILLDLPHPNSFALSRVYSKEFYSQVRRHLMPDGFIILDAPVEIGGSILKKTLAAAGFETQIAYGEGNTFIYAEASAREFSREPLKDWHVIEEPTTTDSRANSIWNPRFPLMF